MAVSKRRVTNTTILLVVEGYTEEAFVKHLKQLYMPRGGGVSLTVKNARGQGPLGVADALCSACRIASFDYHAALLDSDIELCPKSTRLFTERDTELFISVPAIEATLLGLQGERIRERITTAECKQVLGKLLPGDSCDGRYYERNFDKALIDARRADVGLVDSLLNYMANPGAYLAAK